MNNILDFFPKDYTPRKSQIEALEKIQEAINGGYKFIICCLPTGAGKSFIPATLANCSNSIDNKYIAYTENDLEGNGDYNPFGSITLTVSKSLQDQYENTFDNAVVLKGKRNYQCNVDNDFDCEIAPCSFASNTLKDCLDNQKCSYFNAKREALRSKFAIFNYSLFLSSKPGYLRRQFIICDEASELEDEIVSFYTLNLDFKRLKHNGIVFNEPNSYNLLDIWDWLYDIKSKISLECSSILRTLLNKKKKSKKLFQIDYTRHKFLENLLKRINILNEQHGKCEFVVEQDKNGFSIVPLHIETLGDNIFNLGNTIVLMSATIFDHQTFAKSLGISNYKYIEIDSTFDHKKSPIYCSTSNSLNYKNMDITLPKIVDQIIELCKKHDKEKGIIHCHNFKVTEYLKKRLGSNNRFLFRELGVNNEYILEEHYKNPNPTVLVSPSMDYGISLDGDYGRFQIVVKAPYLPLGSKRVKTLFERDKSWYDFKMVTNLIQSCGRCTRSEDDHSVTYILDGTATNALKRYFNKLPLNLRNRIH